MGPRVFRIHAERPQPGARERARLDAPLDVIGADANALTVTRADRDPFRFEDRRDLIGRQVFLAQQLGRADFHGLVTDFGWFVVAAAL